MPSRLQTHTDANSFINGLHRSSKMRFQNDNLVAEVHREEPRNSKREYVMRFFRNEKGRFLAYGFCGSPYISDLVAAFKEELAIYSA